MRVLGLASCEAEYQTGLTGVGGAMSYLFREVALQTTLMGVYQPEPSLMARAWSTAFTWSPSRETWRRSYKRHRPLLQDKSRQCRIEIERLCNRIDVVLQWEYFFAPTDRFPSAVPYCVYNDWTTPLIEREYPRWLLPRVRAGTNQAQQALLRNAAFVFTFTDIARNSVVIDYGIAPERVVTVGAGANLDEIPESFERDCAPFEPVVLLVGNDYVRKGVDVLMRAMPLVQKRFPRCRAVVAGGSGNQRMSDVPGVEFRPEASKPELDRLYRQATLFALPTRAEPFGHVFAEAMAYQLPCLGSDTGGVPEVIDDGHTGYLVPVGDHAELATRIISLLANPERMRLMGEEGRRKMLDRFTWERVVARMLPYLKQAAGRL
jgi:glycosyltransferase involved in cell wall biosynthesis